MGLEGSAIRVVFFVGIVAGASTLAAVLLPVAEHLIDARDDRVEAYQTQREESLRVETAHLRSGVLTLTAVNDGDAVVPLDGVTLLVDGASVAPTSATVGGASSGVWAPGETATFVVPGVSASTARVLFVTQAGTPQQAAFGDPAVVATGVGFSVGAGGNNTRYFHSMSTGASGTTASGVFKTKNAADTRVDDVLRVHNPGAASRSVTLTGSHVSNATVEWFAWTVMNGTTTVATLDYRDAQPSASFTLPAGTTYHLRLRLDLADGSGKHNSQFPFEIRLGAS